jgi:hypothetical protein
VEITLGSVDHLIHLNPFIFCMSLSNIARPKYNAWQAHLRQRASICAVWDSADARLFAVRTNQT